MLEEEPCARVERSAVGEQLLVATGEAHIAVIGERLKRKFGAAIVTHTPKVPYKETIRAKTQVEGRYKKQTGGHGMFGHVWIEIEPSPGNGVEFAERVVGGSVPKGFFPGIEKGIREAAAEGVLAGYPLSDFKATLYDGSFHTVDSNELSFKIAASMALKKGVMDCKPALLEPIMAVEVRVPEAYMGDVNRDLNTRRGTRPGHGHGRRRHPGRVGPRAAVRAVHVRDGAALADPRPGRRSARPSTTTRKSRATSRTRSSTPIASRSRPPRTDRPEGQARSPIAASRSMTPS